MTEREQKDLARRITEIYGVFNFDLALELVQTMPAEAERLIRMHEESVKRQKELDRAYERLHRAAQEFR